MKATTMTQQETTHSIYGASGASRWRLCPGSVRVIEEAKAKNLIPKEDSSEYAQEGTEAHEWAMKFLNGELKSNKDIPEKFHQHLKGYLAFCLELKNNSIYGEITDPLSVEVFVEDEIPLYYRDNDKGTIDFAVVCDAFIHIVDLKYGAGVKVTAEENDQAMIYAYSFINDFELNNGVMLNDDFPVFITIYQPRHYSFDGTPDTWETTVAELREHAHQIEDDYLKAKANTGDTLNPSDKACRFCAAKSVCKARAETSFGGLPQQLNIDEDFDLEDIPKGKEGKQQMKELIETLSDEQVAFICKNGSTIKKVIDDVIDGEVKRLKEGGEIKQMKLVQGNRGNRTWTDKEEAASALQRLIKSEAFKPRELITAPQAIKKLEEIKDELSTVSKIKFGLIEQGNAKTVPLIHRPQGKLNLVSVDDKRDAVEFTTPEEDFETEE